MTYSRDLWIGLRRMPLADEVGGEDVHERATDTILCSKDTFAPGVGVRTNRPTARPRHAATISASGPGRPRSFFICGPPHSHVRDLAVGPNLRQGRFGEGLVEATGAQGEQPDEGVGRLVDHCGDRC